MLSVSVQSTDTSLSQLTHHYPRWYIEAREAFEPHFKAHVERWVGEPISAAIYDALNPGRRVRPTMYYALWKCSRGEYPSTNEMLPAIALELFHTASIIVDDIADGELTRRDKAPLYRLYDIDTAILVSHYMVGKGCEALLSHPNGLTLTGIWMHCYAMAVRGQFMNLRCSEALSLAEQQVESLNKTLPFFSFLAQSLNTCLDEERGDLLEVLRNLGWCFQVSNDVVDLVYFTSLGRHHPSSTYLLPPSFLVPALVQEGHVQADEVCSRITYDRYVQISRAASSVVGKTDSFLNALFQPAIVAIGEAKIPACQRDIATDFVKETTKPSFWLHCHHA